MKRFVQLPENGGMLQSLPSLSTINDGSASAADSGQAETSDDIVQVQSQSRQFTACVTGLLRA
ncbi:hypothetical protein Pgy4_27865 [Pseudomonas savastanoi pv. glycinea str. race 4]|uniref:Uncharacterized protein n=1 Tax=Pseudomonas savastanoi pv. glycinea str. race 4 TaxID=875330 RepID=F3CC65_PSESG|nr:hypothetical protein Pgy4_27865 [Pseudomonas savastanoi pv. glycinea str. race 4]